MNKIALAIAISLLAGLAVGAWIAGDGPPREEAPESAALEALPEDAGAEERLQRLERIIAEEREARIALEDTLAMLFEDIERLDRAGSRAAAAGQTEAERSREARTVGRRGSRNDADWIRDFQERRVTRLVDGGFSEDEARRLLEQESEAAFQAMQADWDARRNGESVDFLDGLNNQQAILRGQIGDDAYARYLAAQGQPTSVRVTQVLSGSPGTKAGLQPGDQVISYNGERVFNIAGLRQQTMQGDPGGDVVIDIDRDGVRMQLTIPRGPIGITGSGANVRGLRWRGS